jgi:hypothetical protein
MHGDGIILILIVLKHLMKFFLIIDEEFVKNELENYIQLILLSNNKTKYLSKNNLNYKRVDLIHSILPNSIFLIPIREPLQHAIHF